MSVSIAIIFLNQIYVMNLWKITPFFYMHHLPVCQSKKKSYNWRFKHMVVEPHTFSLFCCREWVIFCLLYCLWWAMNQKHFGVLLLWWNALDPILIVTKMACTLNFLHYLRFISSLSPWQAAYTHTIVDCIVLHLFVNLKLSCFQWPFPSIILLYLNIYVLNFIVYTSSMASWNNLGIFAL